MAVYTLNATRPTSLPTGNRTGREKPAASESEFDETVRLRPARGIAHGLLLSVPFWVLVAAGLWYWL